MASDRDDFGHLAFTITSRKIQILDLGYMDMHMDMHFPQMRVKFNNYQYKISNWITAWIIIFIEFRNNLYKRRPIDSLKSHLHNGNPIFVLIYRDMAQVQGSHIWDSPVKI